jgi:hypothetical protein
MRFSQANWITIDDAARSLTCGHCTRTLDLSGESFGVLGFVRTVSKLARQHFSCPEPGRDYSAVEARRQEAVARELAATIALEGEDVQRALEGRSGVVSIAKVLPMSLPVRTAPRRELRRNSNPLKDQVLCVHCRER